MNDTQSSKVSREQSEAEFHDARIQEEEGKRLSYAYASVADVYRFVDVPHSALAREVLEVGCFRGDQALRLAGFKGRYIGIDISPAAIEHCRQLALPDNYRFDVDDANLLATIEDGSIDYAFGNGVLHHLDLERFGEAMSRKLAAQGVARFVEPAQGNLLLRAFRRLTPRLRTPDEHPFDEQSFKILQRHFDVRVTHHAFVRPYLPMLLLNHPLAVRFATWIDNRLLGIRALQGQAWLLQIELRPKRP
jgi:SAM-dependent methyltransferase